MSGIASKPHYYEQFQCIAGACEDTCCAGWQIGIDEKSRKRYLFEKSTYGKVLRRKINWLQGSFRQYGDGRCAFLQEDNLCEMYCHLGKESLCTTCRRYPRHVEEFENKREYTLSLSCPEVAKLLVALKEPVTFTEYEIPTDDLYEDFDYMLFDALLAVRDGVYEILQNRSLSVYTRMGLALGLCYDVQVRYEKGFLSEYAQVIEKYRKPKAILYVERVLQDWKQKEELGYRERIRGFAHLYEAERLKADWEVLLLEAKNQLFDLDAKKAGQKRDSFQAWLKEHYKDYEILLEQLAVYFISTYFLGAVYDKRIYHKASAAFAQIILLEDLLLCRWERNDHTLDEGDVAELLYRYSREIEHSDPNLEWMENFVWTIIPRYRLPEATEQTAESVQ